MNWRISIVLILLVFSACKEEKTVEINGETDKIEATISDYLIEVEDFLKISNVQNIIIVDFRKKEAYLKEHIKGAINIWRTDIEDTSYSYKGMMASPQQIESLFSSLGINNEDTIVIYDDNGLCDAARLWWILQNYDFTKVKLLHGGLKSWKAHNGKVSNDIPSVKKTVFKLSENPSMKYYVSKEGMLQAIKTDVVILDTRSADEFSGKRQKKGATKGGRIPNSMLIDWAEAIDFHGDKKIKSIKALNEIYNKLNITKNDSLIVYCHSGVRSAHTTFVLTQMLGYKNVKNYDGSWTEWSYFDDLPIKKDNITTIKK